MWAAQLATVQWLEGCLTARGRWVQCWPFPCGLHSFFLLLLRHGPKTGPSTPVDLQKLAYKMDGWSWSKISTAQHQLLLGCSLWSQAIIARVIPCCPSATEKWEILKKLFSALFSSAAGIFNLESSIIWKTPCSVSSCQCLIYEWVIWRFLFAVEMFSWNCTQFLVKADVRVICGLRLNVFSFFFSLDEERWWLLCHPPI